MLGVAPLHGSNMPPLPLFLHHKDCAMFSCMDNVVHAHVPAPCMALHCLFVCAMPLQVMEFSVSHHSTTVGDLIPVLLLCTKE